MVAFSRKGRSHVGFQFLGASGRKFFEELGTLLAADGTLRIARAGEPEPFTADRDVDVLGKPMDHLPNFRERRASFEDEVRSRVR
ncbi:MAG TPA: hypothetical protein VGA56_06525 [Opitutaceae bacterium]